MPLSKRATFERGKAVTVTGLAELQQKIRDLGNISANKEAHNVVRNAGWMVRSELKDSASGLQTSSTIVARILASMFSSGQPKRERDKLTVLTGLRKAGRHWPYAPGYEEWPKWVREGRKPKWRFKGPPKSPRAKKPVGVLVGESWGVMFELGTTKTRQQLWFRPTITRCRQAIVAMIAEGYKQILEKYCRA